MGINARQLIDYIIYPALRTIGCGSDAEVQLIAGTCAQESSMGFYIKQTSGPALGIFQMEPATHEDIWKNNLFKNPNLAKKILNYCGIAYTDDITLMNTDALAQAMLFNLRYAAIMCRLKYMAVKPQIPAFGSIVDQANYWKKYYNSPKGAGTTTDYLSNFDKYLKSYYLNS